MLPQYRLARAIKDRNLNDVNTSLASGADPLGKDLDGKSMLRLAASTGDAVISQLLIDRGADVNETVNWRRYSLLHLAALTSNYGMASILLQNNAVADPKSITGQTPLHLAAKSGNAYLATLLIEYGADINCKDRYGNTPIHYAVAHDQGAVIKFLAKKGAYLSLTNRHNRTPLDEANFRGYSQAAEIIQKYSSGACAPTHTTPAKNQPYR